VAQIAEYYCDRHAKTLRQHRIDAKSVNKTEHQNKSQKHGAAIYDVETEIFAQDISACPEDENLVAEIGVCDRENV